MTSYTTAHIAAQFCTHAFSILLFRESARLMRWDRVGAILSAHAVFLGIQPCRCNRARPRPYCYSIQIHEGFDEEISFWPASADSGDLKVKNINFFKCCCHGGTNPTGTYRIMSSLTSRATRTFKAWCLTTRRLVFLKDTWRILSTSLRPEHEIYEKLTAAKVQYMIYGDCARS